MKRLLFLLTMLVISTSACGKKVPDIVPDVTPDPQIAVLEAQVDELQEYEAACKATVGSQEGVITNLIDDVDNCTEEYSFLEDTYDELLASVSVEPTPEPTEESTVTEEIEDPNAWRYICGTVKAESRVFQKSYNKQGVLRVNGAGNWILKGVPTKEVAGYYVGDTICFYMEPFQVDRMRVVTLTGRAYGYYFPITLIDHVKPVNPNE